MGDFMLKRVLKIRVRYSSHQKQLVKEAILATINTSGIVVSHAKTVREICATANYNRSVELPVYCVKKN